MPSRELQTAETFIVFNDHVSHVVLDASVLIDHIGIVLPELYSWHVVKHSSILKPSGGLAIEDKSIRKQLNKAVCKPMVNLLLPHRVKVIAVIKLSGAAQ